MINRQIMIKLLDIEDLPTLPDVMEKILQIVDDERASAHDLTAVLECDHAISARVLRMANSAFYGLRYGVDSIRRAVVVIGFDAVRLLALATSVFETFSRKRQFALEPGDFWMHSLGTAKAAQLLAKRLTRMPNRDGCFTVGLLHDMGKYLLALSLKAEYHSIVRAAQETQRPLHEVEHEWLGTNHAEVGAWVAEKWNLPPLIIEVMANLYRTQSYDGPYKTEIAVVALANNIARVAEYGNAGDYDKCRIDMSLANSIGLPADAVNAIVKDLQNLHGDTKHLLEIMGES